MTTVAGGLLAWTLAFAGLGVWGLAVGAVTTGGAMTVIARVERSLNLSALLAFGFAFGLLSWPLLWFIVGLLRYWLTGQSLGA